MVKRAAVAASNESVHGNKMAGTSSEEAFARLRRPDYLEYCKNAKSYSSNKCSCKALVCKQKVDDDDVDDKSVCMYASVIMKMALSCTLKRSPSEIDDFENMTKEDCECQFSRL